MNVQIPYTRSQAGLHLLVDSTGIKFLSEGEWKCKKHSPEHRRQWRKLHIGIDAYTLQIRAITVTSNNVSDAAVIPDLLGQLPADEVLKSMRGDETYDTQPVHEAVIGRGAIPMIPPQECPDTQRRGLCASQCGYRRIQAIGAKDMENLERQPPQEFGGNQDELHQATW